MDKHAFRQQVFPACAGMFLFSPAVQQERKGFPRVRGDVPPAMRSTAQFRMFSPRARGCSNPYPALLPKQAVFPACAGMFPAFGREAVSFASFPRVRGDVPQYCRFCYRLPRFSPRARGCSVDGAEVGGEGVVFPACAGMFRIFSHARAAPKRFPRVRGDVPTPGYGISIPRLFSPRARGCSFVGEFQCR